jgi:hypothetical protein
MNFVEFYSGGILPIEWGMRDPEMEARHNYIQKWFPLMEPSRVLGVPAILHEEVLVFRSRPDILDRMRVSLARMRVFYARTSSWKRAHDHNHLRISRILKSLTLMGLREEALEFRDWILRQDPEVSQESLSYWNSATENT